MLSIFLSFLLGTVSRSTKPAILKNRVALNGDVGGSAEEERKIKNYQTGLLQQIQHVSRSAKGQERLPDCRCENLLAGGPPAISIRPHAPNNSPRKGFAVTIGETKPWDPGIVLDHVDDQRNAV